MYEHTPPYQKPQVVGGDTTGHVSCHPGIVAGGAQWCDPAYRGGVRGQADGALGSCPGGRSDGRAVYSSPRHAGDDDACARPSTCRQLAVNLCEVVVTYTTGATSFQGFVLATLNSALVEVLSRTGVLAMTREALKTQYDHGWRCSSWWGGGGPPRPPFALLPLTSLGKFKRVYLGCKTDSEFWPVYGLVTMRLLGYGLFPIAHDRVTGELLPALRCGADVIAVVGVGELLTEACMYGATWAVGRWLPDYSLHIVSVRPRGSVVATLLMWWYAGILTFTGIVGSGPLVEELVKQSGGGGGGGGGE